MSPFIAYDATVAMRARNVRYRRGCLSLSSGLFWASVLGVVFNALRIYAESLAMLQSTQDSNLDLLDLCNDGRAQNSKYMRNACGEVRVEEATHIYMRALSRTVAVGASQVYDVLSRPFQAAGFGAVVAICYAIPYAGFIVQAIFYAFPLLKRIWHTQLPKEHVDIEENDDISVSVIKTPRASQVGWTNISKECEPLIYCRRVSTPPQLY